MTPAGSAALATVRLRGPGVGTFIERRLSKPLTPGRVTHVELRDDEGVIDDPVAMLSQSPSPGTPGEGGGEGLASAHGQSPHPNPLPDYREREQTLDLTLHGGLWVVDASTALLERDGFARVTFDSFDDQTIEMMDGPTPEDRARAAMLAVARTELAVRMVLTTTVEQRDKLRPLLVPPTVAIVGAPNAGKSTLANALFGQKRSIVSPVAGTTRDWVGEEADINGLIVQLLDTPGLRATSDAIEEQAIAQSAAPTREAGLIVVLLDGVEAVEGQLALARRLEHECSGRTMRVLNKVDLARGEWKGVSVDCAISARDGVGVDELRRRMRDRLLPNFAF
ncbi:MAG: 50S ribosome-binding GTPase [Tepidisphaeraceae bacterium]